MPQAAEPAATYTQTIMSAKYPYLKLSLRYIHGAKSTTVFSYPSTEKAMRPSFDAPAIIQRFVNITEFFVTGCHDSRRYFSFVSVDDADGSGARIELTLSFDSDVLMPGRSIINLVNSVKNMLESEEAFTDDSIAAAISASGFPEEPLRSKTPEKGNDLTGRPCYRTYVSATDLATILSFPRQVAYGQYSETVLVHATTVAIPENPLPQITSPVAQAFTVVCPEGVTPSAETVVITDRLSLTYTRAGFEPSTVNFEVGTTNRFVRISGPALIVNDAKKASIVFVQKVEYTVASSKGNPIGTYTILINGRTATRADGCFEVTSNDFNKEGKVNIAVSSTNFFTTSIDFTSEELAANKPLELILVPEEMPVVLRLDFGAGRLIQQELLFEKSSAEYRQLRAGNFHGFRAHRLMSHEPETYNVDMSVAAAPVPLKPLHAEETKETKEAKEAKETKAEAPAGEAAKQPEAAPEKPAEPAADKKAETPANNDKAAQERPKSAAELRAERLRKDIPSVDDKAAKTDHAAEKADNRKNRRKAYANDIPRKADILEDDPDDDDEGRRRSFVMPAILAGVAVVLIVGGIVWYLFTLLPSESTGTDADTTDITAVDDGQRIVVTDDVNPGAVAEEKTAGPAAAQTQTAAAPTAEEKADIDYLNSHETWRLADLKSEKYRSFYNMLCEGNIEAIANSDYFAVKDLAKNKKAVKIVEYLWEAKGTLAEKRNVSAMRNLKKEDAIDIHKTYELLARMRDPEPNTTPRPQRDR